MFILLHDPPESTPCPPHPPSAMAPRLGTPALDSSDSLIKGKKKTNNK